MAEEPEFKFSEPVSDICFELENCECIWEDEPLREPVEDKNGNVKDLCPKCYIKLKQQGNP